MMSMYLLIPLSLMLFVIGIWAVRYAVKSNQFEDLDNAAQRVILDDRQERRQALNNVPIKKNEESNNDALNQSNEQTIKSDNNDA